MGISVLPTFRFVSRRRPVVVAALVCGVTVAAGAQRRTTAIPSTPSDKTIVHVLNRIGFGPAPGDVEKVKTVGLAAYIEQQLHPERLTDERVDARIAGLDVKLS